jgi:hypothetical protein
VSKVPRGFTGHVRDLLKGQVVTDPKVKIGRLRILQRTDGLFVIFDKALPLGQTADGDKLFVSVDDARKRAIELCANDVVVATTPASYDADLEAFAGMKRAMANGFAWHEPAYDESRDGVADGGRRA